MITKITESPLKNKRYRVYLDNNEKRYYDFGYPGAFTYIDGASELTRLNYQKRHLGNKTENILIQNLVPSPSLMSFYILWGKYRDITRNINYLNNLWRKKHG